MSTETEMRLPDEKAFRNIMRAGYLNTAAAAYVDALNQRARLLEAARAYANTCALMALRDCADPDMLKGWRDAQQNVSALLRELGE